MLKRAEQRVEKALSFFTKAKQEVEKANAELNNDMTKGYQDLDKINKNIQKLEAQYEEELSYQSEREFAIEENHELIKELDKFSPERGK
ncbi:hypothetical protein LC065_20180 (plasmid) [Halobacillus litoralis]|uniref:hypothetical protein n=1 Tax=Halobacillus litoralis TaxID=45668 RepID=UPI001CFC6EFF|nr:hypothetical protein [Halobacillus litoralis]WLR49564.1 hypothetical protein LC065_20180 [Halobacillus litoralis]